MVPGAVNGVIRDVFQGVVHPPHVPLERKSQAAIVSWGRHPWPRGGFLSHGHCPGIGPLDGGVHLLQELNGIEILAATVLVGEPFALFTAVIEVQNRGDSVDTQSVDVELIHPVQRVRHEEVAHFCSPEVEDVGAPILLFPSSPIGVLVAGAAVEAGECPLILGEVPRDPVHDDPDSSLVEGVDKGAKLVGSTEARCGGVIRGDLVPPRPRERVFGDRHEFHMRVPHVRNIGHPFIRELCVGKALMPGLQVNFVNRDRRVLEILPGLFGHPLVIGPCVITIGHDRRRSRRHLSPPRHGVGLIDPVPIKRGHAEFVVRPGGDVGDENFPNSRRPQRAHGELVLVPRAERSGDCHALSIRRPHSE